MSTAEATVLVASKARDRKESDLRSIRIGMVGNVVTQPFSALTGRLENVAQARVGHLDFGQVVQTLEGAPEHDFLVVHLDHRWFFEGAPDALSVQVADELVSRAEGWLGRGMGTLVLNTVPFLPASSVESDLHVQMEALAAINASLLAFARRHERVSVVDVAGEIARIGYGSALRERNRLIMQAPYSPAASAAIVDLYERAIRAYLVPRRKALVVDADNTLWGGVIGEVGADNIAIDSEFPGIVHLTLQNQLKRLRALGVLLCVVTKNNEEDFLEAFHRRVMPLKLEDITTYRSNWAPKSENIRAIADQLNIGLDSIVFIDDNPFEIEEVGTAIPEVDCHLFRVDRPEAAIALLDTIGSLRARSVTDEDAAKAEQYRAEDRRAQARSAASTLEDYLASLKIEAHVNLNNRASVRRIAQLTNKTNQFNLTCRRYTEAEIEAAMSAGSVYDFRVIDRFGDMGIVGVAVVRDGHLENMLMSCRALGRQIEAALLRYVCDRHQGMTARFVAAPRNAMVQDFLDRNGFALVEDKDGQREYRLEKGPVHVDHLTVIAN